MKAKLFLFLLFIGFIVLAGCSQQTVDHSRMNHGGSDQPTESSNPEKEVDGKVVIPIEAKEVHWMYNDELMDNAWTYNGTLPGNEIRVQEGDEVEIQFTNSLPEPSALHLHGLPVANEMDGVPGVTQNAVLPGETFTYELVADTPGTYWYHSHQDGAKQVDKGLYGALIIEPKEQKDIDIDKVIILDEWSSSMTMSGEMDHSSMENGSKDGEEMAHAESMEEMYDTFLINGKAAPAIEAIQVKEGDTLTLRFINAGLYTQVISIPGHSYLVTHYDGQEVNEPETLKDVALRIAPAERYDIQIKMNNPGAWGISSYAEQNKEKLFGNLPVTYEGYEGQDVELSTDNGTYFDMTTYGKNKKNELLDSVTKQYDMLLSTKDNNETFLINNKKMPNHEVFEVEKGDIVKVTITNDTEVDHPMHLHGQFFQVISKNGIPISGSPIIKDTLNVRPTETYEVIFKADNPGNWMFHCHELHHASSGMVAEVKYKGYSPLFVPNPTIDNKPE
jgi:FtsP/CotA-like multicopper oxidase with cupredoxin domain